MRKMISFFAFAAIVGMLVTFTSCSKDDDDNNGGEVVASKVKTLTHKDDSGIETFNFTYRTDGKIDKIHSIWKDSDAPNATEYPEDITFDWSTAGKLTIKKGETTTTYDVNSSGYITKEPLDKVNYVTYEYDSNGFFIKKSEYWDGTTTVKYNGTVTNNNLVKQASTRSSKAYSKTFEFTSGTNTCNIQQTNYIDNSWKQQSGLFGKASAKLVDRSSYGFDGETKSVTVFQYTFDSQNRPASMSKSGDGWSESDSYTYY